ncbi:MAG: xanthine dehydrogenase family protein molybdopterin-binding subunit [Desulfobacterales bacterium]|nr:xanthine dehydrogenase family protein molybdopterin-binding subunit [Desulfobacterales bacterium]
MEDYSVIGKRIPRVDGRVKVTGEAKYAADYGFPGMLWCKILRAPHAHARILNIDTSRAERLPGVKGIVTGKDFRGWRWGWMPKTRDEAPLADDSVRYLAEAVAAVAASDEETAEEATELIKVDYEELPGVFDPEEAMREGAPLLYDHVKNNISWDFHMDFGDVEKAFREADLVREERFETGRVITGYLEPPAAVALWDSSGITIWAAKQSPYFVYRHLAACFNLPLNKVRIIQPFVGGGFGGTKNDSLAGDFCACLLSKMTGRPVKFVYTMEEVLMTCRRRHNMIVFNKMGMKKDGTITGMHSRVIADGGGHTAIGPLTMYLTGCMSTLPYNLPNFKHDAYRIFTNNPIGAAMRGHGVTHTRFAAEIQMEMMAEELGLDPVAARLKNAITAPHVTVNKVSVDSCGLSEGLKVLAERPEWKARDRKRTNEGPIARGVGISGTAYLSGARQRGHQSCAAVLRLCEDGSIDYLTGATDCGQGSDTVLVQVVAEELGLRVEDVDIKRVDTAVTPCDPGSYGSRVTVLAGEAAQKAARDVRQQLAALAAEKWEVDPEDIVFKDRQVYVKGSPDTRMSFENLAKVACYSGSGGVIVGKGYSQYGIDILDFDRGAGNSGTAYSFTSQMSEVDVDLETGFVKCQNMVIAHDCGKPLNPINVEAQNQGAAVQGLGQVLYEEFKMNRGNTLNANLVDYKMPLSTDSPRIEVIDILTDDPHGIYGAKEASEGAIVSTPPSVVSAIHDATGIWFKEQPVTPEKIVMALKRKREGRGSGR